MSNQKKLAIIAGSGPGLGQALMQRFEDGGYHAVGLVRSEFENTGSLDIRKVDLTQPEQVSSVMEEVISQFGAPKVVVHNTAQLVIRPFADMSLSDFEETWRSMVFSLALLGQNVLEPMAEGEGGSLIVSGATASLRGGAKFSAFASAKFALRGLTQSLAREYQASGIHVAHVILDGIIDSARSRALHSIDVSRMMKPEDIAEIYWQLAHQPKSTWSHEIDLRPQSENF